MGGTIHLQFAKAFEFGFPPNKLLAMSKTEVNRKI
jgi:hypothetical protein